MMKRFIITLIILLNIVVYSESGYIGMSSLQDVRAQSQTGCWNPNSGTGGGFFNWLGTQISNVADAIANVANAIADFFSGEDSGDGDGEQFGNEEGSEEWMEPTGPPDNFFNPMDDPFFTPEGFTQDEWDIMDNLGYWYAVYTMAEIRLLRIVRGFGAVRLMLAVEGFALEAVPASPNATLIRLELIPSSQLR
jgi:hypothetical protein